MKTAMSSLKSHRSQQAVLLKPRTPRRVSLDSKHKETIYDYAYNIAREEELTEQSHALDDRLPSISYLLR